jgi:rsbT co-antagonist protein RsbR
MTDVHDASKHEEILRRAPLAVIEHGDDLRIADWNDAAERILGFSREEAVGRSLADLILGGDGVAWRRAAREGGDAPRIAACIRKDGRAVRCEWRYAPIAGERGAPAGAVCFGQDVTARFEAEATLRTEAQLFRALIDNMEVAVFAVDRQGTYTFHDGKGVEVAGLSRGELLGKNIFELFSNSKGLKNIRAALAGEAAHSIAEAHGRVWETWYAPIRDDRDEVTSAVGISLDVTQAKRTEQELRAKLDLIDKQQQVIRDLSTPIIEVWSKVLTLPMVGVVDSARTAEVMDSLLEAVVRTGARFAILDLTGVEAVDTKTAAYLFELVRAVRLLGAEGIITGIRPTVAQTVVALGLDLTSITTLSNLRAGLRHCIVQMNRERIAAAPARAAGPGPGKPPPTRA